MNRGYLKPTETLEYLDPWFRFKFSPTPNSMKRNMTEDKEKVFDLL